MRDRREPGFDDARLGECPECGRTRRLCGQFALSERDVCRMHGGKAGRKPIVPLAMLDEESIEAIAAMQAAKDDDLDDEFYAVKHFLQLALSEHGNARDKLEFAERAAGLLDRAVGIKERQARLRLISPPSDATKLEFSDPRVQLVVKQQLLDSTESAIKGTLSLLLEAATRAGFFDQMLSLMPERLRSYVAVERAARVELEQQSAPASSPEPVSSLIEPVDPASVALGNVIVIGGPRTGKTTFADSLGGNVRHADDLIEGREWSQVSDELVLWFDEPGPWVIEGVAVVRGLRKWLASHEGRVPATVVVMTLPKVEMTAGQEAMAKGVETIWGEIAPELERRGTSVQYEEKR